MFRFLHAADIHLDSPLIGLARKAGSPAEEIRTASRRALENLVELALKEQVAFVVLAGDLYDGDWKDFNTGLFFIRQMGRLNQNHIPVFLVLGNHDAASQVTRSLRFPPNVHQFSTRKPETVELPRLGVALHGRSYPIRDVQENYALTYPDAVSGAFNIGVLHTGLAGKDGQDNYAPCSVGDLQSRGYDYWALGHVHARKVVSESPWIVYPGNIQGRHVGETGPKGATLVTVEDGKVTSCEQRELDVMRWAALEVDCTGCADSNEVLNRFQTRLHQAYLEGQDRLLAIRVTFAGSTHAHDALSSDPVAWDAEVRAATETLGTDLCWVEKIEVRTRRQQDATQPDDLDPLLNRIREESRQLQEKGVLPEEFLQKLDALKTKLPVDLKLKAGFSLDESDVMMQLLSEASALLSARQTLGGER